MPNEGELKQQLQGEAAKAAINRKQAALVPPNKQTNKLGHSPAMAVEAVNQMQ